MDARQNVFHIFEVPDPIRIKKAARLVRRHSANLHGKQLLECGYAKGGLADVLRKDGVIATCVDINPRIADKDARVIRWDLNNGFPPFEEKFDIIFAGEVMEHLFDDEKFLHGARNLLNHSGLLVLTVPNLVFSVNRLRMFFGLTPLFAYERFHYHMYTMRTLRDFVVAAGFQVVDFASSHVFFSTRRAPIGKLFEILGDFFPSLGAHLIVAARPSGSSV